MLYSCTHVATVGVNVLQFHVLQCCWFVMFRVMSTTADTAVCVCGVLQHPGGDEVLMKFAGES